PAPGRGDRAVHARLRRPGERGLHPRRRRDRLGAADRQALRQGRQGALRAVLPPDGEGDAALRGAGAAGRRRPVLRGRGGPAADAVRPAPALPPARGPRRGPRAPPQAPAHLRDHLLEERRLRLRRPEDAWALLPGRHPPLHGDAHRRPRGRARGAQPRGVAPGPTAARRM
ncbi:MAG: hypothetical protein AVDCRST_MAG19-4152, partial [uncultured Thermomicrobiales bacterium]